MPPSPLRRAARAGLISACLMGLAGFAFAAAPSGRYVPDVVIVKFRTALDSRLRSSARLRSALPSGLETARRIAHRPANAAAVARGLDRIYEIRLPRGADVTQVAAKLARLPEVEYAEPRFLYSTFENESVARVMATPNDPRFGEQGFLNLIQAPAAWDIIKAEVNPPLVAVVDGGTMWTHQDLQPNLWTNPGEIAGNGLDDDGNGFIDDLHGWDFLANDPDPRGSSTTPANADHGTHTAGLLAAVTNNLLGVASASWNPRVLAVNVSASSDNFIAYGYDGILYAVDNGARIVNLSWGGPDWSQMGKDVVEYAVSQGALLFAAAGNAGNQIPNYPGAYPNVYAVVNTNWLPGSGPDTRRFSSSYGTWVDLAAPGSDMLSTMDANPGNTYALMNGTSMASPVAAAVATLIKAQHPTWTNLQIGEQLRATCDNIDPLNPSEWWYRLGKGRINALRALTESPTAVRITGFSFADGDGNGQLNRGETVTLSLSLKNYRAPAANLNLTLTSATSDIVVADGSQAVGALAEGGTVSLPAAFSFTVASNAALGGLAELRVGMTAAGYNDFEWIRLPIEPVYETHDVNKVQVSLAATGNVGWIGFPGEPGGAKGMGLGYDGSANCLFEGGLLVGTDGTHVADAIRTDNEHTDFGALYPPIRRTPGLVSAQETQMSYIDVPNPTQPLGIRVTSESRAYTTSTIDDFVFLGYRITNTTGAIQNGMRVGLFFDWDIDAEHYATNRADWDAARGMGYAFDTSDPSLPYFGILVLQGGAQTIYAAFPPGNFSDFTKWEAMTGVYGTSTGPGDVSNMLTTGPFTVAPNDSVAVWFALVGGHTLAELQANADQARAKWNSLVAAGPPEPFSNGISLAELSPNPFSGGTRLDLRIDRPRNVSASVFDTRGRRVRSLGDRVFAAGFASLDWDGKDDEGHAVGAGVYFLSVESEGQRWMKKAIVLR